ncbi:hypothetical protein UT300012_22330 [Paraclostridium bifermentans]
MIIFVDHENVGAKALKGFDKLTEMDVVYIVSCEGTGKFTFDELFMLQSSRAKFNVIKVFDTNKDGVDKWIMKTATRINEFHRVFIVSQDKVYDKLRNLGYDNIFRISNDISEVVEYKERLAKNVVNEIDVVYRMYLEDNISEPETVEIVGIDEEVAVDLDDM